MQRVTEYKEKALQALTKNEGGSSPRGGSASAGQRRASDARLNQVLQN